MSLNRNTSNTDNQKIIEYDGSKSKEGTSDKSPSCTQIEGNTEEQGNWRNIIYLPFENYWKFIIVCTTIFNFGMNAMNFIFVLRDTHLHTYLYYSFEMLYLIDTVALLIHKKLVRFRKLRYHQPVATAILVLSLLSLFPYFEIYYLLNVYTWAYEAPIDKTRIKTGVRLLPVYMYFHSKKRDVGVNQFVTIVLNQFLLILLINTFLSCAWFKLKCYNCGIEDWTNYLERYEFSPNNTIHWLIICSHMMGSIFAHNSIGTMSGGSSDEKIFIAIIMLCGYMLHIMIFFGELTAAFIQSYHHHHEFTSRLKKIVYLLNDWNVDKEVRRKIIEYYTVFWERRKGMRDMPKAFELLPKSIQKDVTVDIFWEALRHSHLFVNTDIAFKRSISMVMKNDFLLPGDYLFKTGQLKTKMVYIVSGVVQVLTEEDNDSPILSLSSGSLLGEMACLRATVSQAYVKCATYCELHTLDMVDLYKALQTNQKVAKYLMRSVESRITSAKIITEEVQIIRRVLSYDVHNTSIKRLKKQWHVLSSLHKTSSVTDEYKMTWKKLDKTFSSQYMDLIVLSQEVELKVQAICLSSKCPLIMDPNSSFRSFCEYLTLLSCCVQFVIVPYMIFFDLRSVKTFKNTLWVLDLVYYLDIYIQLTTAVKVEGKLISNSKDIILYRLKEISFIVDVFAAVPFRGLTAFFSDKELVHVGNLPRVLKIYKIFILINEKEKNLWTSNIYMRFLKYVILSVIFQYSCTCLLFAISCQTEKCSKTGWFVANGNNYSRASDNFAVSFLYATSLYFGNDINKSGCYIISDIIIVTLILYLGYFMYSFIFAEFTASAVLYVSKLYAHQDEILVMKSIMKHRFISSDLYSRFIKILDFNWLFNEGAEIQGPNGIFNDGSEEIKSEIVNERLTSCLRMTPLFSRFSEELIKCLSLHMRVTILPAETQLIETGATVLTLYIIMRGYCSMRSQLPGDRDRNVIVTLKRGDVLSPIELLHGLYAVCSIWTITAVEIMHMPYDTFHDIMRSHRSEYAFTQKILKEHLELYENILQKKVCRLPELRSAKQSLGKIDSFEYSIFGPKESHTDDQYLKPFEKLHQWSCIRYFMLRRTIDPCKKFFLCWEIIRNCVILIDVTTTLISMSVFVSYWSYIDIFVITSRTMATIDIYLRLHCQYYNENGILVTHPLSTAKNYIRHSFVVDVLVALPLTVIGVARLYGPNFTVQTKSFIRLITRPIQLYRPLMGLNYFEEKLHWSKGSLLMKLKYSIIILVVLGICSNMLLLFTCRYKGEDVSCSETNWLSSIRLENDQDVLHIIFIKSVYFTIAMYASALCGTIMAVTIGETKLFLGMVFILHLMRCVVISKFTSSTVGGNINLSIYQARMKQFLKFAKEVKLSESLIKETVAHNEYVWKETQGTSIINLCSKLNLYLRVKFVCFLYEDTLRSTSLFVSLSPYSLRRLALSLEEVHFKKDAQIIRCNDVQTKLYVVYKGKVEVSVANVVISTLEIGGIFGCFSKTGMLRQTLNITAQMHTIVLAIDSKEFHKVMSPWDNDQARRVIRDIRMLKLEYLEPFVNARECNVPVTRRRGLSICYSWLITNVNKYTNQESYWFWLWEYMMNVHLSVISSIIILLNICISLQDFDYRVMYFVYVMDLLYTTKILFGFTLQYVDVNTGIVQKNPRQIMVLYLKSWFWFDLLTLIPFEQILLMWQQTYVKLGTLNRVLRFFYMVHYYNRCNDKLDISKHLRWTYLIYRSLFHIQIMVNIWIVSACFNKRCIYIDMHGKQQTANSTLDSVTAAYSYVVNVFTATGLRIVRPLTLQQLIVALVINFCVQYVTAILASGFATMISIENYIMNNYKYSIQRLSIYLKDHHLSPAIFNNVRAYLLKLWKIQRGEWMPLLIHSAPAYLRQDIMKALYMQHLENHYLFEKTHNDFLRQLVIHLERCIYFPGNYIVAQGDMDNTIYFVHKGEVGAYNDIENKEEEMHVLKENMSFGEAQGIEQIPYDLSYKAITTVEVLALRRSNWEYLLKWFPASEEAIKEMSDEYGMFFETKTSRKNSI